MFPPRVWIIAFLASLFVACQDTTPPRAVTNTPNSSVALEANSTPNPPSRLPIRNERAAKLVAAAVRQYGRTVTYDPSYVRLGYPNGDVPLERGVCSDVVVRALRGVGVDLQARVHEDMRANFRAYPNRWGLRRPDRNIDHRRVANLMTYFTRRGASRPVSTRAEAYRPGDVVAWKLPSGQLHIGVVTDQPVSDQGTLERALIAHNIGSGVQLEDVLFSWEIIGHYRVF
jgi:hypothetical protein